MGRVTRKEEIARKRRRKAKLAKLRNKIQKAKDPNEVKKLVEKIYRVHPFYPMNETGTK